MGVPVLTAVTGAPWEAELVTSLERAPSGVEVVRRCVDLPDLLAAAVVGSARAVLLSADLRRLDRDALSRLRLAQLAVVGLFTPGDEEAERRLRQLGVDQVLPADVPPEAISRAVSLALASAVDEQGSHERARVASTTEVGTTGWSAGPADERRTAGSDSVDEPHETGAAAPGRLLAVWGPTGAPGRTSIALAIASEAADLGVTSLLVDADVYGGTLAQMLGVLDESPGLAAAVRSANAGSLDVPALARSAPAVAQRLRLLSGISRADRWPELRPAGLEVVLRLARRVAALTVVDCGFSVEEDEELAYDTSAPRRNGATLAALAEADVVVVVGAGDPVGVQRLVRSLAELREVLPDVRPLVVLNKVRRSAVGADPEAQLAEALERYAGVRPIAFVPHDLAAFDAALVQGRSLREAAPGSAARAALRSLAGELAGRPAGSAGRRRRGAARDPRVSGSRVRR
jgi:MinD-like ATPase involved in chromosome partitioning or flagellar assembly